MKWCDVTGHSSVSAALRPRRMFVVLCCVVLCCVAGQSQDRGLVSLKSVLHLGVFMADS